MKKNYNQSKTAKRSVAYLAMTMYGFLFKVHGDNMGPIWGRQDPGGPHVGPMNFVIWDVLMKTNTFLVA